ncbi:lectin-like domain-containing protein [Levilactobacillus acidifarinae]|nr:hypothetical protein [Levilactobacillus acidifarinae]GEO69829.1 cell surface protein [Levilactobacillus acidifarinae]
MKQRWYWGALLGLLCLLGPVTKVHAETAAQFISRAPQGIALKNAFVTGDHPVGSSQKNSALVISAEDSSVKTQAVLVTSAPHQFGTIWSQAGNEFDLTHDVTTSMWMYFGDKKENAADGMALVIHNDPRGRKAMPQFSNNILGETLGVWGVDNQSKRTNPQEIAATAIQNSWALEFDTFLNKANDYKAAGKGTSFDTKLKGPHIAANYPGEAGSYTANKVTSLLPGNKPQYYFNLNHINPIQGNKDFLSNGRWHHLTLDWQSQSQTLTYTFNDKDPQTEEPLAGIQRSVKLDLKKIDPENTGKATWGFTGSNGDEAANNLVIFEGVPGLVNASAQATLTDLTTHKSVGAGGEVRGDSPVQLDYRVKYHDGKQDWQGIQMAIQLPERVRFTTGKIVYPNRQTQELDLTRMENGRLVAELKHTLTAQNTEATVQLTGTTQNDVQPQPVALTRASFSAINGIATTALPRFKITPNFKLDLQPTSPDKVTIKHGQTTTIKGNVSWPNSIQLTNQDLRVQAQINGINQKPQALTGKVTGEVTYVPAAKSLKGGHNDVQLKVYDTYGNTSQPIKVDVYVIGTLSLDLVRSGNFQTTTLTGQSQANVVREGDWKVLVRDTRAEGTPWQLQVAATPFTRTDDHPLDGQLVYVEGTQSTPISTKPVPIHRGAAMDDQPVTNVTSTWDDQRGLSLNVGSQALTGQYQAEILWSLNDAPN